MIPQLILILCITIGITANFAKQGEVKPWCNAQYYGWSAIFDAVILLSILHIGGFFDIMISRLSGR